MCNCKTTSRSILLCHSQQGRHPASSGWSSGSFEGEKKEQSIQLLGTNYALPDQAQWADIPFWFPAGHLCTTGCWRTPSKPMNSLRRPLVKSQFALKVQNLDIISGKNKSQTEMSHARQALLFQNCLYTHFLKLILCEPICFELLMLVRIPQNNRVIYFM